MQIIPNLKFLSAFAAVITSSFLSLGNSYANVISIEDEFSGTLRSGQFNSVNATDYGVKCNGIDDETNLIQLAINESKGHTLVLPNGTCIIAGVLNGREKMHLRGQGISRTTLKKIGSKGHILDIIGTTNKDDIEITDITFDINHIDSGIIAEYVTRFTLRRDSFINAKFWGVNIGVQDGTDDAIRNDDVTVEDCEFHNQDQTYEHLLLFNTQNIKVSGSIFTHAIKGNGIGLYQNIENVLIKDSTFSEMKVGIYYSLSTNNIFLIHNQFDQNQIGVQGANLSDHGAFKANVVRNITVRDSHFTNNTSIGLIIGGVIGATISGSTFEDNAVGALVNNGSINVNVNPQSIEFNDNLFKNNNKFNLPSINAPGVQIQSHGGSLKLIFKNCQFFDDREIPLQLYPVVFSGGYTFDDVEFLNSRMSAYRGAKPVGVANHAVLGSKIKITN